MGPAEDALDGLELAALRTSHADLCISLATALASGASSPWEWRVEAPAAAFVGLNLLQTFHAGLPLLLLLPELLLLLLFADCAKSSASVSTRSCSGSRLFLARAT